MDAGNAGRNRAILYALIATFIVLVIARMLISLFWVAALGFAIVFFALAFGFFIRAQRGRRQ